MSKLSPEGGGGTNNTPPPPPPQENLCRHVLEIWRVHFVNRTPSGSHDGSTPNLSLIIYLNARSIAYASTTVRTLYGGAGMAVADGDSAYPTLLFTKQHRGATVTSSFNEDKTV